MVLKSMYLLPHGGVIIPGMEPGRDDDPNRKAAADQLLNLMQKVGQQVRDDEIDIIFLTSPHGYLHPTDVQVVFNGVLEGWQYFHEVGEVQQQIFPSQSQLAQIFHHLLQDAGLDCSPVILADGNFPIKISWGEGIPLHFISSPEGPQIVLFYLPMIAGKEGDTTIIDTVARVLFDLCESEVLEEHKVAIVVSGDLSHRHDEEHEYGFDPSSKEFDKQSMEWIENPTRAKFNELMQLQETAASCGIFGMGLIQWILERPIWALNFAEYALPTYFGMSVAHWDRL